jgi:DNA-binding SARP family transcriptional activator
MPKEQRMAPAASAPSTEVAAAVYQRLPYALVVLDDQGSVLNANPAAIEMAWRSPGRPPPTRCHELLACRGPDGPCRHGCLVQRVAQTGQAPPEIRIDTPPGAPVSAVWVTANSLGKRAGVLLHLRPGDARDRRRRSDPHWITGPELSIKILGRTRVDSREGPLGGHWLRQRPGQIFKYLLCERERVVQAEEIAEALWPHGGRQALSSVRHYIHSLRHKLEPARSPRADSSFIVTVRGGYAINRRHVRVDADLFTDAAAAGLAAHQEGATDRATELLTVALSLYRGDLLEDEPYAEWAMPERDRLRSVATEALQVMAGLALAAGDRDTAIRHLKRLAELEPLDSHIQKELLQALILLGRRSEAVRRYSTFRARLAREFASEPGFTLADLDVN